MKEIPLSISNASATKKQDISPADRKWKLCVLVSCVGWIGGVSFGLAGLTISGLILFGLIERTRDISSIGSLLAIISFSFLVLGAHEMDRMAEIEKDEKLRVFEAEHKRNIYSR